MKKTKVITIMAILIATASFVTGCGNGSDTSPAETSKAIATSDEATAATTEPILDDTEKAIVSQGLKVNDNGKIIDSNGKEVETTADGKVKIETADGKTVEISADKIKETNAKSSNGSSSLKNSLSEKNNSDTSEGKSTQNSGNTSKNGSSTANGNSSDKGNTNQNTQNSSTGNKSNGSSSTTSDPHAGKTYHEAVYKTVNHPAETKQVKVVDKEAYSYEEPVYETKMIAKCKDCGMDLSQLSQSERTAHSKNHVLNEGGDGGWYTATEQVQVGTKTVNVPEQSHYETKVIKEAWTEKVLVKEAGWY